MLKIKFKQQEIQIRITLLIVTTEKCQITPHSLQFQTQMAETRRRWPGRRGRDT